MPLNGLPWVQANSIPFRLVFFVRLFVRFRLLLLFHFHFLGRVLFRLLLRPPFHLLLRRARLGFVVQYAST